MTTRRSIINGMSVNDYYKRYRENNKDIINKRNRINNKKYNDKYNILHPEAHLISTREYARRTNNYIEKRAEIDNCVICNSDISSQPSNSKYCQLCRKKSKHYKFINKKWILRYKKIKTYRKRNTIR